MFVLSFDSCRSLSVTKAINDGLATSCFDYWLNRYQTLLGAIVAVSAAGVAWTGLRKQVGVTYANAMRTELLIIRKLRRLHNSLTDSIDFILNNKLQSRILNDNLIVFNKLNLRQIEEVGNATNSIDKNVHECRVIIDSILLSSKLSSLLEVYYEQLIKVNFALKVEYAFLQNKLKTKEDDLIAASKLLDEFAKRDDFVLAKNKLTPLKYDADVGLESETNTLLSRIQEFEAWVR